MALFRMKPHYRKRGGTLSYYGTVSGYQSNVNTTGTLQIGVSLDNYAIFQTVSSRSPHYLTIYDNQLTFLHGNYPPYGRLGSSGAAAHSNNKNYVLFGGYQNNSSFYKNVYVLYSSLTTGSSLELQSAKAYAAAASCDNLVLFAGGCDADGTKSSVDVFTGMVRSNPVTISARQYIGATVVNNTYFLFAGGISGSSRYSKVDAINKSMTKLSVDALADASYNNCAGHIGKYALITGGLAYSYSSGDIPTREINVYDSSLTKLNSLIRQRAIYHPGIVSISDFIIIAGGSTSSSSADVVSTVDVYNTSLTSIAADSLSAAMGNCYGASVGNYAIFCGSGINGTSLRTADVYQVT